MPPSITAPLGLKLLKGTAVNNPHLMYIRGIYLLSGKAGNIASRSALFILFFDKVIELNLHKLNDVTPLSYDELR